MTSSQLISACLITIGLSAEAADITGPHSLSDSPQRLASGEYVFYAEAPQAKEVRIKGQWSNDAVTLNQNPKKEWASAPQKIPAGVWEYSLTIDGLKQVDPGNPCLKPQRKPTNNYLHVPGSPALIWDWQNVPHGTVHQHTYVSSSLGRAREVTVYTPPGYEQSGDTTFPLLVLQHGSGDNNRTWIEHGKAHWMIDNLIAQKKAQPLVVVMIDGHPLGEFNWRDSGSRDKAYAAFEKDLMESALPEVEKIYRVKKESSHRAIAGLSMGGAHALSVGLKHTDRFSVIGAFSAAPPPDFFIEAALAAPQTTNERLKRLWIAIGEKDFLIPENRTLIKLLKEKGIKHEYIEHAGDHSWPIWRQHLADFVPLLFQP
jgi:enterochelin esterase-like enzyme